MAGGDGGGGEGGGLGGFGFGIGSGIAQGVSKAFGGGGNPFSGAVSRSGGGSFNTATSGFQARDGSMFGSEKDRTVGFAMGDLAATPMDVARGHRSAADLPGGGMGDTRGVTEGPSTAHSREREYARAPEKGFPARPQAPAPAKGKGLAALLGGKAPKGKLASTNPAIQRGVAQLEAAWGRPLSVISGARSPSRNAAVGGAKKSQHLTGNAVDLDVAGLSTKERNSLIDMASRQGFTGIGVYDNSIHLDYGSRRSWGPSYGHESVPGWAKDTIAAHMARTGPDPQAVQHPGITISSPDKARSGTTTHPGVTISAAPRAQTHPGVTISAPPKGLTGMGLIDFFANIGRGPQ